MDRFYNTVTDPLWLFTVVIVAVLVNLVSYFLGKHLEKQLAYYSESRRDKLREKSAKRQRRIQRLATDGDYMEFTMHKELRYWLLAILSLLYATVAVTVPGFLQSAWKLEGAPRFVLESPVFLIFVGLAMYIMRGALQIAGDVADAMRIRDTHATERLTNAAKCAVPPATEPPPAD